MALVVPKEGMVVPPKDSEEIALEKLVFGDMEGFETNLKNLDNLYEYSSEDEEEDRSFGSGSESDENELEHVQDEDLFTIDGGEAMDIDEEPGAVSDDDEEDSDSDSDSDDAWNDSDDEEMSISLTSSDKLKKLRKLETDKVISGRAYVTRLRSQFEKIYPKPQWAEKLIQGIDDDDNEDEDNDHEEDEEDDSNERPDTNSILNILHSSEKFVITKQLKLISPNKISVTRLKDANYQRVSKGAIQSLSFHPTHPLLLTGGFDRTLRVYHVDGKINRFISSLHLRNSPVTTCQFSPLKDENLVYAAGRRRYMNKWNLNTAEVEKVSRMYGHEQFQRSFEYFKVSPKGTYLGLTGSSGWCNLLNGVTGQWIRGFKIEGTIIDFDFSRDESFIVIINTAGEVWEYELGSASASSPSASKKSKTHNKILRRWNDEGGVGITKVKLGGPKNRWLAIGTNNGLVNIYDRQQLLNGSIKPIKTVENLVTSISTLQFSSDGQILCIASRAKRDALRLIHLPSGTVYSNWPTSGTPLGRVTAVGFSPNNELLAIGNEAGKVTLWRLNHY
ncbi:uncharacterized protein KQ657_001688 [Scheffersomyces spartinae]|uniref:U3 small nucleolar RNA-associated protein n=1 Tax=Scheffersomyces spartinae TaxID=45513 RepID=A0A9P7V7L7_9ASCO|nr:uncharacterized protein KQ657_001688 [Scheffersomyces spartinae]KAG7192588.1 hypothetical protein KQ657_001688 [Scheffersomyces spartinae]